MRRPAVALIASSPDPDVGQTSPHAGEPAPEPEPADHLVQDMFTGPRANRDRAQRGAHDKVSASPGP